MARILIDGRFVGVGDSQTRYVLPMVEGILSLDKQNEYTLLLRPIGEKELKRFPEITEAKNLTIKLLDIPHYTIAEQTKLLTYLNKEKFDLVHFTQFNHPALYRRPYVVTIQDLTLVGHLHYFNFVKQSAFNAVMKSAACDSSAIIAISKITMDDVMERYGTAKSKFTLVYHGVDHSRFSEAVKRQPMLIEAFKKKYKISGDYILYTGMWKKHKNILRLLKAFEKYLNDKAQSRRGGTNSKSQIPNIQLVLVGKIDTKEPEVLAEVERINNLAIQQFNNPAIVTTGFVEDEELPISYAGALAYCIPSLAEGFGWPPLEAMACGTPVISSKESCMPEILGDAAYYFDPYDVADIAKAIEKIISDEALRKDLVKKGLAQSKKYDWTETARKTLGVYKKLLKQS